MQLEATTNRPAGVQPYATSGPAHPAGDPPARTALPPMWLAGLAMLAFVVLLLSFNHVVRQAVQNAELRRQTATAQSTAMWRCQALQSPQARGGCVARLSGADSTPTAAAVATADARF